MKKKQCDFVDEYWINSFDITKTSDWFTFGYVYKQNFFRVINFRWFSDFSVNNIDDNHFVSYKLSSNAMDSCQWIKVRLSRRNFLSLERILSIFLRWEFSLIQDDGEEWWEIYNLIFCSTFWAKQFEFKFKFEF